MDALCYTMMVIKYVRLGFLIQNVSELLGRCQIECRSWLASEFDISFIHKGKKTFCLINIYTKLWYL